jgi:hypothetical protein
VRPTPANAPAGDGSKKKTLNAKDTKNAKATCRRQAQRLIPIDGFLARPAHRSSLGGLRVLGGLGVLIPFLAFLAPLAFQESSIADTLGGASGRVLDRLGHRP